MNHLGDTVSGGPGDHIDPAVLTYLASSLPAGASINASTGLITGILTGSYANNKTANVTVNVSDGLTCCASRSSGM